VFLVRGSTPASRVESLHRGDDGVEFAAARLFREIDSVSFERLIFGLGILIRHALCSSYRHQSFQYLVMVAPSLFSRLPAGSYFDPKDRAEDARRDEFVFEIFDSLKALSKT